MKKLVILFFLVLLFACDKKEKAVAPIIPSEHLVTGFNFRDIYGSPISKIGNPNTQTTIQSNGNTYYLAAYPNPIKTDVAIRIHSTDSVSNDQMKLWIVAAPQSEDLASYNFPTANQALIGGQPLWEKTATLHYSTNEFIVDVRTFPAGAYRIYIQTDKIKLWENLLKE